MIQHPSQAESGLVLPKEPGLRDQLFMILSKTPRQPIMLNKNQIKVEESQKSSSTRSHN